MNFDELDDIVNKYNNLYHSTIKIKLVDVKPSIYIDFITGNSEKDPVSKIGDHVRISEFKNISAKGYVPNWSEEVSAIKKVKNTVSWIYVISDLRREEIV